MKALWDYLDQEKVKSAPSNVNELWNCLQKAWNNMPLDVIQKYCNNITKRIAAVKKAIGVVIRNTDFWTRTSRRCFIIMIRIAYANAIFNAITYSVVVLF